MSPEEGSSVTVLSLLDKNLHTVAFEIHETAGVEALQYV
jgi:hypothetical protein